MHRFWKFLIQGPQFHFGGKKQQLAPPPPPKAPKLSKPEEIGAAAKERERNMAAATGNRATILTSPLGDPRPPQTAGKTLLGM